jgi:predicted choloylglycine hydrolase
MKITIHKITIHGKKVKSKEIDLTKISKIGNSGASLVFKSKNGRITEAEYIDTFAGVFGLKSLENYSWNKNAEFYELNDMQKYLWIDNENSDKVFKYAKENDIKMWYYDQYTKDKFVEWE